MAVAEYKTTDEVARRFGLSAKHLGTTLSRYPELKPVKRVGTAYLWTAAEIERFADWRMRPLTRKRKEK